MEWRMGVEGQSFHWWRGSAGRFATSQRRATSRLTTLCARKHCAERTRGQNCDEEGEKPVTRPKS